MSLDQRAPVACPAGIPPSARSGDGPARRKGRRRQGSFPESAYGDVPKWLKGPDSKSGRSVPPARGFKSLHLRHVVANCVHDVSGVSLRAGAENFVSLRFSSLSPRKHVVGLRGDFVCRGPQKNAPSRAKRDFSLTKGSDAAAICASSPLRNAFRKGRRLHLGEKGSTIQVKDGKCTMRFTFHESPEAALPDMNRGIGTIS